jgi:hypothetical protein
MRRFLLSSAIFLLIGSVASAQLWKTNRIELTAGLGSTQFFGDIGGFTPTENILGFKDFSFRQTRFNISTDVSYRVLPDVNVRLNLAMGVFRATDERGSNINRGYESRTGFFETSLLGEYYFIKNKSESSYLFSRRRGAGLRNLFESLDFYMFTGIGGLSYNIKGNDLLEAHGYEPRGFTAVVPTGIGINTVFSPELNFGIEIGGRYSFSDNLEGYTSQYSKSNDVYYFLSATVTYKMKTTTKGWPAFLR